jgi:hypothetical protein
VLRFPHLHQATDVTRQSHFVLLNEFLLFALQKTK